MRHFPQSRSVFGINSVPESGLYSNLSWLKKSFEYENIKIEKENVQRKLSNI
jgi:hypothetical protein